MDDRYRNLKNKLYGIHQGIKNLKGERDSLNSSLDNNISFDGKNPVKGDLSDIKASVNNIDEYILYTILPKINKKINNS